MAVTLKATKRDDHRGSTTRQVRESGQVPAIVYGKGKDAKSVSVDSIELIKTVRDEGRHAIISLTIGDEKPVDVMLHEYQMHSLKDELIHADFYIIDLAEAMDVGVPLRLEGESQGSKDGGILQQPLFELQVRAKPNEIPEEITVNVSSLEIGDSLTIGDLPVENTFEYIEETDTTIAIVLPPEAEEETDEEEVDLSVEPEVVGADDDEDGESEDK